MTAFARKNAAASTLGANFNVGNNTLTMAADGRAGLFSDGSDGIIVLIVGNSPDAFEIIHATARAGSLFTGVTRAQEGTSEQSFSTGTAVVEGLTVEMLANLPVAWSALTGVPATFPPSSHGTNHQTAGSDPIPGLGSTGAANKDDYKVTWDGTNAVTTNLRTGIQTATGTNFGKAVNDILTAASIVGPAGSQALGTPGASIQLANIAANNAAIPIVSTDWIGKPLRQGTDGVGNGTTTFTSATTDFTGLAGRIVVIAGGGAADGSKDLTTTLSAVVVGGDIHKVTLADACLYVHASLGFSMPITYGSKIKGQGLGTRNQGNGHPDDGGVYLQATGGGWANKGVVDFRNAPAWTSLGFGSEMFEIIDCPVDANSLADYAIVGYGVGTGNAAKVTNCVTSGGTVANYGIGNHYDHSGSADLFLEGAISGKPAAPVSKTWQSGGVNLPQATITLNSTSGLASEGFVEIQSTWGTQLVEYAAIAGSTITGCIGGKGLMANGNTVKQYPYALEVNMGDVYVVDDFNFATNDHAILVNQKGAIGNCFLGAGHMAGGSGGVAVVIAYCKRFSIGAQSYSDNGKGDRGVAWVCPMAFDATTAITILCDQYNLNDSTCVPVVLDGANLGGDVTKAGWGYTIGGTTNGHTTAGVGDTPSFVRFVNNWPTGAAVKLHRITAACTLALYSNDSNSSARPDEIDSKTISLSSSSKSSGALAVPDYGPGAATASLPTVANFPDGTLIYDQTFRRWVSGDGAVYRLMQSSAVVAGGGLSGSYTADMSLGDYFKLIQTTTATFTMNSPSNAKPGMRLVMEFLNSTGGSITTFTFGAAFILTNGVWGALAANKSRRSVFTFNGANWVEDSRSTVDY